MKKFTSISLIFMIIFSNLTYGVTAAVTEGVKNDVLNSEYVVIVNTSSKKINQQVKLYLMKIIIILELAKKLIHNQKI